MRGYGDETVAFVCHFLSTPYPIVRATPLEVLFRYRDEALKIAKLRATR